MFIQFNNLLTEWSPLDPFSAILIYMHFENKYVYKIYLRVCPTELAHPKEITISFEQKPVNAADIWKENLQLFKKINVGTCRYLCLILNLQLRFHSITIRFNIKILVFFNLRLIQKIHSVFPRCEGGLLLTSHSRVHDASSSPIIPPAGVLRLFLRLHAIKRGGSGM